MENVSFEILRTLSDLAMSGAMSSSLDKKYDIKELFHTFTFLFIRSICRLKGIKVLDDFNNNLSLTRRLILHKKYVFLYDLYS